MTTAPIKRKKERMKNLQSIGVIALLLTVLIVSTSNSKANAITVNESNFVELVQNADKPILLDFWAPWCPPCRKLNPIIQQFSRTYGDYVIVGKVNIDRETKLSDGFGVESVPTLVLIEKGKEVGRAKGYHSLRELKMFVGID